ncbi:hypothetical protein MRS44_016007 [Fusarium solani]|uniref:uncharacterized protein n=1 Tax=Fusarium solani TaxID=169388 RepID=UPI0032C431ED|nr:hypothetical protein MRS44_016007 [Fusarium solani]
MFFKLTLSLFFCLSRGSASSIAVERRDVDPSLLSMLHLMKQIREASWPSTTPTTSRSCLSEVQHRFEVGFLISYFPAYPWISAAAAQHTGVGGRLWVEARSRVLEAIRSTAARNPGFRIAITGHSLGGAIASLAAAELRNNGYNVDLYTFGAPRVGDDALSTYITNQAGGNYRVTHYNDPVPRVPPMLVGYAHISPEYYISTPDLAPVTTADIRLIPSILTSWGFVIHF